MINLSLQVVYQCLLELTRLHNNNISMTLVVGYPILIIRVIIIYRSNNNNNNYDHMLLHTRTMIIRHVIYLKL